MSDNNIQQQPTQPAEVGLSQIIAFLLEKFSGGSITITAEEWDKFIASHVEGLLKTEVDTEMRGMTITSMIGDEAASMRLLLSLPDHGRTDH